MEHDVLLVLVVFADGVIWLLIFSDSALRLFPNNTPRLLIMSGNAILKLTDNARKESGNNDDTQLTS